MMRWLRSWWRKRRPRQRSSDGWETMSLSDWRDPRERDDTRETWLTSDRRWPRRWEDDTRGRRGL